MSYLIFKVVEEIYYPLMINLQDKSTAVVGGGKVGYRKAKKLLEFGARVKVISPKFVDDFIDLKKCFSDKLEIIEDKYKEEYIQGCILVIATTSYGDTNKEISSYCKKNNILCNVADDIELSDFIVPSTIRRGDLVISISTMGKSPALSAKIRRELEEKYTTEYEEYVELLGNIRELILENITDESEKVKLLKDMVDMNKRELQDLYEFLLKNIERRK